MLTCHVPDMTCNHCVMAITEAVKSVDPAAGFEFDLAQLRARISSAQATPQKLRGAIVGEGHEVDAATDVPGTVPAPCGAGGGCG